MHGHGGSEDKRTPLQLWFHQPSWLGWTRCQRLQITVIVNLSAPIFSWQSVSSWKLQNIVQHLPSDYLLRSSVPLPQKLSLAILILSISKYIGTGYSNTVPNAVKYLWPVKSRCMTRLVSSDTATLVWQNAVKILSTWDSWCQLRQRMYKETSVVLPMKPNTNTALAKFPSIAT